MARKTESAAKLQELKERVQALEAAIRDHRDQKGDDRCWMDDVELYNVLPEGVGDRDLRQCPPEEMKKNCERFIALRAYPGSYYSPMEEVKRLESLLDGKWKIVDPRRVCTGVTRIVVVVPVPLGYRSSTAVVDPQKWSIRIDHGIEGSNFFPGRELITMGDMSAWMDWKWTTFP